MRFSNKLELRYSFNEKSNYMDAMIRHRCEKEVLTMIRSLSDMLDVKDATSPYSFYEYNNVANKFTISEIDFESSDISVVRSSRLDASRGYGR